jgi:nicotinic acid phosphoribosyltransferase
MNTLRKALISAGLVGSTLAGGALGAALLSGTANAATNSSSSSSSAPSQPAFPAHGTPEHEGQEKAVTGDAAAKAQDAAVQSVGGGTAGAVTTDMTGNGYEVTVTKADSSQLEVRLDSSFNVMQGGPGGHHGGPGRPNDNDADDQPASSGTTASSVTTG